MSADDTLWLESYKNRNVSYTPFVLPSDEILLQFHSMWFSASFDEAARILSKNYSVRPPTVKFGKMPEGELSHYDISTHVITISIDIVITTVQMSTFLQSFFMHLANQKNWMYDKPLHEFYNFEKLESDKFVRQINSRFRELEHGN